MSAPRPLAGSRAARRRAYLIGEMLVLYLGAPLGIYVLVHFWRIPLFMILLPVAVLYILLLTFDGAFVWRRLLSKRLARNETLSVLGLFALTAPMLTWLTFTWAPEDFLHFPRRLPALWLLVMVFYPLISVTTQEIVFRVFFFHRYEGLFGAHVWPLILLNALLFSFAHIIFQNWVSIVLTFLGGLLFAWRYVRTNSFWAVVLEHALYGNLLFTIGLGRYFFTGISNLHFG